MTYWWVNQSRTFKAEHDAGLLWAPKATRTGRSVRHWTAMTHVGAGDVVFHYARGAIRSLGRAQSSAYSAERPYNLPEVWESDGWAVPVAYADLARGVERDEIPAGWRYGHKEAPFDRDGNVKLGYLFPVSDSFAEALFEDFADRWPPIPPYRAPSVVYDARELLTALVDRPLVTLAGRANRIIAVHQTEVIVATERSPEGQPVPITDVQHALELLARDGEVIITPEVIRYRSAFIGAVLRTLPGATIAMNPPRVYAAQPAEDLGAVAGRQRRRDHDDAGSAAQLLQRLGTLRRWTRDQTVAVHKPLLLLMAFARVRQGLPRLVGFPEIEVELRTLIAEFSPLRGRSIHPEYPFWRLQHDGLWEVINADDLPSRASNTDPPVSVLRSRRVQGGLPPHYYELLRLRGDVLEQAVNATLALLPPDQRASVLARIAWDSTPPQAAGELSPVGSPPVGVAYQGARPTAPTANRGPYEVDPDKVDRGRQAHEDTLEALASAVRAQRLEPLEPEKRNPPYDLAWETPTSIFVADVKSLTLANAEHQLRLGLGQVLRYWHSMATYDKPVIPVLAVEEKPEDSSWLSLCERLGVHLVWPERMPEVIAKLCHQP
jgi:hypothetical protein